MNPKRYALLFAILLTQNTFAQTKPVVVDYDSIPPNKDEVYGKPIFAPTVGHSNRVISLASSPDGRYVLTGSADKTVKLWDMNGNEIRTFTGHLEFVTHVDFSNDGKYVIASDLHGNAILWNINGTEIAMCKGFLGFLSDGKYISSHGIMDLNGTKLDWFNGNILSRSSDGKYMIGIAYGDVSQARIWDINGKEILVLKGHSKEILVTAFSPKGNFVLTGSADNTAKLWDLKGKEIRTFRGHSKAVDSVDFSSDGNYVLTGSYSDMKLWSLNGNEIRSFEDGFTQFSPNGKYVLNTF